jgi:hypothetical protein
MKKHLFILGLTVILFSKSFSQELTAIPVEIINKVISQDTCLIYYNLDGKQDTKYKITLYLKQGKDNPVNTELKSVAGNAGIGFYSGKGNKIIWDKKKESLKVIDEKSELQFEIKAEAVSLESEKNEKSFLSKNIYWIGGGALVAGSVVTYFLLKKKTTEPDYLPDPSSFKFPY